MTDTFLDKVYDARDANETKDLYDQWAASYETEIASQGYATPARCAAALALHSPDKSAPVLDFGCGTGLSGVALKRAGFDTLDGVDLSQDMLRHAQTKQVYRTLRQVAAGARPIDTPGAYAAIAAIGVIGAGAAPIETFDMLMNGLAAGGKLVFSFNDHALKDPGNEGRLSEWIDCGAAQLLFKEYGEHLPGLHISSNVYIIEKT